MIEVPFRNWAWAKFFSPVHASKMQRKGVGGTENGGTCMAQSKFVIHVFQEEVKGERETRKLVRTPHRGKYLVTHLIKIGT